MLGKSWNFITFLEYEKLRFRDKIGEDSLPQLNALTISPHSSFQHDSHLSHVTADQPNSLEQQQQQLGTASNSLPCAVLKDRLLTDSVVLDEPFPTICVGSPSNCLTLPPLASASVQDNSAIVTAGNSAAVNGSVVSSRQISGGSAGSDGDSMPESPLSLDDGEWHTERLRDSKWKTILKDFGECHENSLIESFKMSPHLICLS